MTRTRPVPSALTAVVTVVTLVLSAPPAAAKRSRPRPEVTREKKREVENKKRAVQGQLDLAKTSDAKVEAEVNRLTAATAAQQQKAAAARRADAAARAEVAKAVRLLAVLEERMASMRQALVRRAVAAYMRPEGMDAFGAIANSRDPAQASRQQALLSNVQGTASDTIDAYRTARDDEVEAKQRLEQAQARAAAQARVEAVQASRLRDAQRAQQAAHDELQRRIDELQEESNQLARQEAELESLIRAQQAAAAAALAAKRAVGGARGPVGRGPVSDVGLVWPLQGRVTSEYGPRWGGFHPGIDIADPTGTPIGAAKDGVVISAGPYGGYGNFVVVDHGDGLATAYAHQSRIAVRQGQTVDQGEVIGYVGSTGYSTGPHLHFEVRINGAPQNPRRYEVGSP